jgi:hypothetical protein
LGGLGAGAAAGLRRERWGTFFACVTGRVCATHEGPSETAHSGASQLVKCGSCSCDRVASIPRWLAGSKPWQRPLHPLRARPSSLRRGRRCPDRVPCGYPAPGFTGRRRQGCNEWNQGDAPSWARAGARGTRPAPRTEAVACADCIGARDAYTVLISGLQILQQFCFDLQPLVNVPCCKKSAP